MKVLHLSSFDRTGGAARAALRLHEGFQEIGVDSSMLVQFKSSQDSTVQVAENKVQARVRSCLSSQLMRRFDCTQMFSPQWFPDAILSNVKTIAPDVINLNWVCNAFLQIETLPKLPQPLFWTLQDMWSFTGGCHYSQGCQRYEVACGQCPQLHSNKEDDLSRWIWQRKIKAWENLNLTIIAPSEWMAQCARASSIFKDKPVEVIPFGLDTEAYRPVDQDVARKELGLPPESKKLVLFGALDATGDTRKGFHLLQSALKQLSVTDWSDQIELVVFGSSAPEEPVDLGFPIHYLGQLRDDASLRHAYAAADVMIAPSIEEAFGQTATESLACGTPVVVFANTGLADIVDHQQNGYIADYCNVDDLAKGIAWVLEDSDRHAALRQAARSKAEREYATEVQAHRYLSLFHEKLQSII